MDGKCKYFSERLKQFAFAIIYRSGKSALVQFLLWFIEKLIICSGPLMYIFQGTSWDSIVTFCSYFKVFFIILWYFLDFLFIQFNNIAYTRNCSLIYFLSNCSLYYTLYHRVWVSINSYRITKFILCKGFLNTRTGNKLFFYYENMSSTIDGLFLLFNFDIHKYWFYRICWLQTNSFWLYNSKFWLALYFNRPCNNLLAWKFAYKHMPHILFYRLYFTPSLYLGNQWLAKSASWVDYEIIFIRHFYFRSTWFGYYGMQYRS